MLSFSHHRDITVMSPVLLLLFFSSCSEECDKCFNKDDNMAQVLDV